MKRGLPSHIDTIGRNTCHLGGKIHTANDSSLAQERNLYLLSSLRSNRDLCCHQHRSGSVTRFSRTHKCATSTGLRTAS
jgi:hypothetical protein